MDSPDIGPERADDGVSAGQRPIEEGDRRLRDLAALIASSPHNLISRSERSRVFDVHVREAVAVAAALRPTPNSRWMDLGTGGGLPGLVLATLFPDTHWDLVDATAKKLGEVQRFATALGLGNVATLLGRAEVLAHDPALRGRYDGVTARAVAPLPTLLELARGFLRPGGTLVAIKGPRAQDELQRAHQAMRTLRYEPGDVVVVDTPARPTQVVTMRAVGRPPSGFPRRTGVPNASPLGALPP